MTRPISTPLAQATRSAYHAVSVQLSNPQTAQAAQEILARHPDNTAARASIEAEFAQTR